MTNQQQHYYRIKMMIIFILLSCSLEYSCGSSSNVRRRTEQKIKYVASSIEMNPHHYQQQQNGDNKNDNTNNFRRMEVEAPSANSQEVSISFDAKMSFGFPSLVLSQPDPPASNDISYLETRLKLFYDEQMSQLPNSKNNFIGSSHIIDPLTIQYDKTTFSVLLDVNHTFEYSVSSPTNLEILNDFENVGLNLLIMNYLWEVPNQWWWEITSATSWKENAIVDDGTPLALTAEETASLAESAVFNPGEIHVLVKAGMTFGFPDTPPYDLRQENAPNNIDLDFLKLRLNNFFNGVMEGQFPGQFLRSAHIIDGTAYDQGIGLVSTDVDSIFIFNDSSTNIPTSEQLGSIIQGTQAILEPLIRDHFWTAPSSEYWYEIVRVSWIAKPETTNTPTTPNDTQSSSAAPVCNASISTGEVKRTITTNMEFGFPLDNKQANPPINDDIDFFQLQSNIFFDNLWSTQTILPNSNYIRSCNFVQYVGYDPGTGSVSLYVDHDFIFNEGTVLIPTSQEIIPVLQQANFNELIQRLWTVPNEGWWWWITNFKLASLL